MTPTEKATEAILVAWHEFVAAGTEAPVEAFAEAFAEAAIKGLGLHEEFQATGVSIGGKPITSGALRNSDSADELIDLYSDTEWGYKGKQSRLTSGCVDDGEE